MYKRQTPDTINPDVTIISPTNTTYDTNSIVFNVTGTDDTGVSDCEYTLTGGVTNYTMANLTSDEWNATNITMSQGGHQVIYYCNDTTNNLNNTCLLYTSPSPRDRS